MMLSAWNCHSIPTFSVGPVSSGADRVLAGSAPNIGQPPIDVSVGGSGSGSASVGSSVGASVGVSVPSGVAVSASVVGVPLSVVLQPASAAVPVTPSPNKYS